MTQERQYIPTPGTRVRMRLFSDYTSLGLPPWTTLTCEAVIGNQVVCKRSLTANGERDGDTIAILLSRVEPPCG